MRHPEGRSTCRVGPSILPGLQATGCRQKFGWDVLTLRGVFLETSVVEYSLKAMRKAWVASWDLPDCPIVKGEGC